MYIQKYPQVTSSYESLHIVQSTFAQTTGHARNFLTRYWPPKSMIERLEGTKYYMVQSVVIVLGGQIMLRTSSAFSSGLFFGGFALRALVPLAFHRVQKFRDSHTIFWQTLPTPMMFWKSHCRTFWPKKSQSCISNHMPRLLLPGATAPQPNKSVSAAVAFHHTILYPDRRVMIHLCF